MSVCIQPSQESTQTLDSCLQEDCVSLGQDNSLIAQPSSESIQSASKTVIILQFLYYVKHFPEISISCMGFFFLVSWTVLQLPEIISWE